MNKKKLLTLAMVFSMIAILAIGGTIAYFTDNMKETNTITFGDISAELYESKYHRGATEDGYLDMEGQNHPLTDDDIIEDDKTYHEDYLKYATLMPFDLSHKDQVMFEECTVAKNAYVKNTSNTNDCFVRVRYMVPEKIAQYLDIFYVDTQFISKDDEVATADARTLNNEDTTEPMITEVYSKGANFTEQGTWYEEATGYWYADFIYAERLTPGEMTLYSPISKITLIPSVTEKEIEAIGLQDGGQFEIVVKAEVIQADGFLNALEAFEAFDNQLYIDYDEK